MEATIFNWTLVHDSHAEINEKWIEIPINPTLTGKYLIFLADSTSASPAWYRAGYLIPIFVDDSIGKIYGKSKYCPLRRNTFIELDDWECLNSFVFKPVPWLADIQIKIWSTSDYGIYDKLDRIEEKLNDISAYN